MFQLDDNFLNDVGLGAMPEEQKKAFLQHIYQELEMRVGTVLAEGLTDDQLGEFEKVIERDASTVQQWLPADFANTPEFQKFMTTTGVTDPNDPALQAEFAATRWLEANRPDYRDVVAKVLGDLKNEIKASKDTILGAPAA